MSSAASYYDRIGDKYINPEDAYLARYHEIRLTTAKDLLAAYAPKGGALFDFGCGSGEMIEIIRPLGFKVTASDISPVMANLARERTGATVIVGGIHAFTKQTGPFAAVTAINVLPYLTEEEERLFFEHARKTISPGGVLVVSHTNKLLDLVTFNRYTVEFYRDNLIPALGLPKDRAEAALNSFAGLITNPTKPEPTFGGLKSERDALPKRRVDPFTYPDQIAEMGFEVLETKHINSFPLPPLLVQGSDLSMPHLEAHNRLPDTLQKIFCSQFQLALRRP